MSDAWSYPEASEFNVASWCKHLQDQSTPALPKKKRRRKSYAARVMQGTGWPENKRNFQADSSSQSTRFRLRSDLLRPLWEANGGCCQYCSRPTLFIQISRDHYYPRSKGGKNTPSNYFPSCRTCQIEKADMIPDDATPDGPVTPGKPKWRGRLAAKETI